MLNNTITLLAAVEREPFADAIVDSDKNINYKELLKISSIIGNNLISKGLREGDRLITVLQNNWQATVVYWACQLYGIIITPINWRSTSSELDYFIKDSDAKAIIFQDVFRTLVLQAKLPKDLLTIEVDVSNRQKSSFDSLLEETDLKEQFVKSNDTISIMLYTSGTTGVGKGVPRSHLAEKSSALAHVSQNKYEYKERTLGVMPLYHTMGIRLLLSMCIVNGCFICQSNFDSDKALDLIEKEKVTSLYLVPTLYHDLITNIKFSKKIVKKVRKLGFAGAPMSNHLIRKLNNYFNPDIFVNHYGSSEIYTFTYCENAAEKPGSAGKPGINQMIRIIDINSLDISQTLPAGIEGKIIASMESSESFKNYWNRPDADKESIVDGWYITGDLGYFDEEGDLFVTGRLDDMIISGGENILPVEVENILSTYPDVIEAVVCGIPDERLGEIVAAFIKSSKKIDIDKLDAFFLKSTISSFKRPRKYFLVDEIPKSPVGKILRRKLREQFS
ncbi:MAG: 4-chlorobenzoate--CoA ligase [Alphaproteobacteria bacterium MarineAlpha9_Bin1]|nr:MAG: 4-chlorobenzoate--CoA ligase [Alphaproteobacteria bacterium MarineAlpha9_Bin1]